MASPIPSPGALRVLRSSVNPKLHCQTQIRHASLLRRPKRPYTFTQLVTLSDGSSFVHRTTNPIPVYKSTKDVRNTPLWNPSSQKLLNIEEDEAGRLKAFRAKFGRGWDAEVPDESTETPEGQPEAQREDSLMDLISGYSREAEKKSGTKGTKEPAVPSGKGKGGQK
ncbi:uncharacterized protein BDZ99DRAFT_459083 [Mytilinidion resinicola]|uniref:Ribosomal protein bL31m N-terminal domain-containing protein n=1 Tax=Mytilinidion resinicola TaxID=574789 RepID=A0A6A6Z393_9PEZI|nr:uncharacterized protein BDZ99DRAFT_459083 [Mytilinidion resinicola]KAF2815143.1 hypothetical protein BDZ99DRAFT_459083 [Mytilinidion resinicola]